MYCNWCGNVEVKLDEPVCETCRATLEGPLLAASAAYHLIAGHYGVCCSGIVIEKDHRLERAPQVESDIELAEGVLATLRGAGIIENIDASHLYIHPKDGENHNDTTAVECGVNLYVSYARCYWIFDSDRAGFSEGREYGPEISYQLGTEQFMEAVKAVLNQAANAASACGIVSCEHCGDHYHEDIPCDCREEAAILEEDTMNPYGDDPANTDV
jgi:hypothetical protein